MARYEDWREQGMSNPLSRLCHTCRAVKPLRTKHCRQCNRCVLTFDHHCPYIYNCVGVNNRFVTSTCVNQSVNQEVCKHTWEPRRTTFELHLLTFLSFVQLLPMDGNCGPKCEVRLSSTLTYVVPWIRSHRGDMSFAVVTSGVWNVLSLNFVALGG